MSVEKGAGGKVVSGGCGWSGGQWRKARWSVEGTGGLVVHGEGCGWVDGQWKRRQVE